MSDLTTQQGGAEDRRTRMSLMEKILGVFLTGLIGAQGIEMKANYDFRKDQATVDAQQASVLASRGLWMPAVDQSLALNSLSINKLSETQELLVCFVIARERGEECDPVTLLEMRATNNTFAK